MLDRESHNAAGASGGGRVARRVLWWLGVVAVVGVLFADPLDIHPLDQWMHRLLGHQEEQAEKSGAAEDQLWTCPMHPQILQKEPGSCPICGMDLVPRKTEIESQVEPPRTATAPGKDLWTCGMHPNVVQDEPGSCPICQMDLVPMRTAPEDEVTSHGARQGPTVRIDPVVIQNMNVTTQRVERRDVRRQIRTVGYLDYDQQKMVSVTTRYSGFVEKTYVDYIGQPVHTGQPLFEVYSPELVQTEEELLTAKRYVERMQDAPSEVRERASSLLEAARTRLRYWDISPEQITRLEATGEVRRTLTVVAPAQGTVMKRMEGLEGMAVKPGMDVLHIADLSNLWLIVEIFEGQLPWIDVGSAAEIRLTYFPGHQFRGKVRFVEPEISPKTRSVRVALDVPNPDGRLRVGMYATVEFHPVIAENAIAIPAQAVIRTGERNVVVVALGGGRFAPREVVLGPEGEGLVNVLEGLEAGDHIVTSSQFLIDSESNLRAAIQKMMASAGHQH